MYKALKNINSFLFLSIATFPLLLPNYNSIIIIFCSVFSILNIIKCKDSLPFNKSLFIYTSVFWIFLLHEVFSGDFNETRILLHLPFLILPLLFYYKPKNLISGLLEKSILVFQGSVIIQCIVYLYVFLLENNVFSIFKINSYNIPFFRTYVYENYPIPIHSTYFSSFLLISFTFSLFFKFKYSFKKVFNFLNIVITTFFIFVYVSKIIIIIFLLTNLLYFFSLIKKGKLKQLKKSLFIFLTLIMVFVFTFSNLVKERFEEVKTEIYRPLEGDYFNSTNVRIAIINCSFKLLRDLPFFGYGDSLQNQINNCFEENYNSNFYKIKTYNTHNYYFNLLLYGGWLFLIIFLCYIIYILFKSKKNLLLWVFVLQVLLINTTENFFSRHYGIILFMYFISLFLHSRKSNLKL